MFGMFYYYNLLNSRFVQNSLVDRRWIEPYSLAIIRDCHANSHLFASGHKKNQPKERRVKKRATKKIKNKRWKKKAVGKFLMTLQGCILHDSICVIYFYTWPQTKILFFVIHANYQYFIDSEF
jgi:hypothetical protein